MPKVEDVLISPIISEKTSNMAGKYTFKVHTDANKNDVKKAVMMFYKVEVADVNMTKITAKTRLRGRGKVVTKRRTAKKAVVTLEAGKTLNFNDFK